MKTIEYIAKIRATIDTAKTKHGNDAPTKDCIIPLTAMESILDYYEKSIAELRASRDAAVAAAALLKPAKDRQPMENLFRDILGGNLGK